ncbi:MAG: PVC-type heme-binding CxxCH protein [Planctomycetia bacterium]
MIATRPYRLSRRLPIPAAVAWLWVSIVAGGVWADDVDPRADKPVTVPEVFRQPERGLDGVGWYRCSVVVPAGWEGRALELFVEPFDAAVEVIANGQSVGGAGEFPPRFRSGLGGPDRFRIPAGLLPAGKPAEIVVRTCLRDGRTGFNVAAPVLFAGDEALRLTGRWMFRGGEIVPGQPPALLEREVEPAAEVEATLRRIDDTGPLSAADEQGRFRVAEDLRVDLVLAEPAVRQPLSVKWDARGRIWVAEFIQYPEPAGLTMVSRDAFLRSVYDKVPAAPPHHDRGLDQISFHEDADGDGIAEKHGVFVDGLSLVSSFAFDVAGLWVLQPPYLLFYPDADRNDQPDGDPVVHLEGFGIEDSHSIANNLRWGPDGWLYAAQGSTVTSRVRRPGADGAQVLSTGQCIWRYHPPTGRYEIFAEGGGNAFGVEFDASGRLLSGHNGGDTRGFHYVQGGFSRKGFEKHGELSNPFAFGFFEPISHHSAPRFTHALAVNDAPALGEKYAGSLFGVAPLQGQVVRSAIRPDRSSLATQDVDIPLACDDSWFRPVDIQLGPDGALYVCDFYEQRIDHASHYQGRIDRDRGRIWRLAAAGAHPAQLPNLTRDDGAALVDRLSDPNRWIRQTALLELAHRQPAGARDRVARLLLGPRAGPAPFPLDLAWALIRLGPPSEQEWIALLGHSDPWVRAWAVRLACDDGRIPPSLLAALETAATKEDDPRVRSQLAASARRLPPDQSLPLVAALLGRDPEATPADGDDIHIPLLVWWAVERLLSEDRPATLARLGGEDGPLWHSRLGRDVLQSRVARRLALGTRDDQLAAAGLVDAAPEATHRARLLEGCEQAFAGRSLSAVPAELLAAISRAGGGSRALRLRLADGATVADALSVVANADAKPEDRLADIAILGETLAPAAEPVLLAVAAAPGDERVRAAALSALEGWSDPAIASAAIALHPGAPPVVAAAALDLLAGRPAWALALLGAIDAGTIEAASVSESVVRRLRLHREPPLVEGVTQRFGAGPEPGSEEAAAAADLERIRGVLGEGSGSPILGRTVFRTTCASCHTLFGEGGQIGPDLTSHDRGDPRALLVHVVNPSATLREGYETTVIVTAEGRMLSGFVVGDDPGLVLLRTPDGRTVSVPRDSIDDLHRSPVSIMPAGLLRPLDDQQVRDLFAYLRSTQPLATK